MCFDRTTPLFVSRTQQITIVSLAAVAEKMSTKATQELLRYLNPSQFRGVLATYCPRLAHSLAAMLLQRVLAEISVSEMIETAGTGSYQTLPPLDEMDFLYNVWETMIVFPKYDAPTGLFEYHLKANYK